jgi:hypothetical protein
VLLRDLAVELRGCEKSGSPVLPLLRSSRGRDFGQIRLTLTTAVVGAITAPVTATPTWRLHVTKGGPKFGPDAGSVRRSSA